MYVIVLLGFYKSYFGLAPDFNEIPSVLHLHTAIASAWWLILIAQPILIKRRKFKMHRTVGYISIVVVILFLINAAMVTRHLYFKVLAAYTAEQALDSMSQFCISMFFFTAFYAIAMLNRKKLQLHISFMVAAAVIMLEPGLVRLFFSTVGRSMGAVLATMVVIYLLLIAFIIFEKRKMAKPVLKSPYLLILGLVMLGHVLAISAPGTEAWRWLASQIVVNLF